MSAPQSVYDLKSMAEHVLHTQRRKGEDTTEARMLLGAVTVAIGAFMFGEAFARHRRVDQVGKAWASRTPHGPLTTRGLG